MSRKNAAEAKDRPISEKQWSTDLTSTHWQLCHHTTAIPIWLESHFSQNSVDKDIGHDLHFHISLSTLLLITFPGMQTCPRPVSYTAINPVHLCTHAGPCWFFSLITWTHHNFVNTAQSSRTSTAWQLRPSHGPLWVAYPKSHCGTAPGASIASTRVQSHTLNPTWIWPPK